MIRKYDARPNRLGRVRLQVPGQSMPVFARPFGNYKGVAGQIELFVGEPKLQRVKVIALDVSVSEMMELIPQTYVVLASTPLASLNGGVKTPPRGWLKLARNSRRRHAA